MRRANFSTAGTGPMPIRDGSHPAAAHPVRYPIGWSPRSSSASSATTRQAAAASQEDLNFRFHRLINRASGSRRLVAELKLLSSAIPTGFYESHPDWIASALRDHREIVDALTARSSGMARTLTEAHFLRGGAQAVVLLEDRGFWR